MVSEDITLKSKEGLHARPAAEIAKNAAKYNCDVKLGVQGNEYNAKSVLNIMAAGIKDNTKIKLICNGTDEKEALAELLNIFKINSLL